MVRSKQQASDDEELLYPMCKPFWLFNVAQIDGLSPDFYAAPNQTPFTPIDAAEEILRKSGAVIRHGYDKASYSPSKDEIYLPYREAFASPDKFHVVANHELLHWTGHPSRLNRNFDQRFGSEAYAFEELIAELGSAFLCAQLGFVDATLEDHASYLESWLKVLKNDKNAIFTASKQAGMAVDFINTLVKIPLTQAA